jgi:hypothetical protein
MRTTWDPQDDNTSELARELDAFAAMGVQHVMAGPRQRDLDGWLRSTDAAWKLFEAYI